MDSARALEIAGEAIALADSFSQQWGGNAIYHLLDSNEAQTVGGGFSMFADHVVWHVWKKSHPDPKGAIDMHRAKIEVGLVNYTPPKVSETLGSYFSWLYYISPRKYAVVYNEEAIDKAISEKSCGCSQSWKSTISPGRIKTRLLLHELGHLVLHRKALLQNFENSYFNRATAIMEEEAWLFAGILVGRAIGNETFRRLTAKPKSSDYAPFLW